MSETSVPKAAPDEAPVSERDAASWYLDPTGRFEVRYWDGSGWTEHVRSGSREQTDPLVGGALHVRLADLDPDDRLFDDIGAVLGGGRRADPPQDDVDAADDPHGLADPVAAAPLKDVGVTPTPESWRAQSLSRLAFVGAGIGVVVALTPVLGSIGVVGGAMTLGVALRARRLARRSGGGATRAVDAALLSVLVVAMSVANVLVTVQLWNEGSIAEMVTCSVDGAVTRCAGDLLQEAGATVGQRIFGG